MSFMEAAKCQVNGSDYIGAFATTTDRYTFVPFGMPAKLIAMIHDVLKTECVSIGINGTDLIGLFSRANSNGILMSNIASAEDVALIKGLGLGINVGILESSINAIGNAVLANDRIAIVDVEYDDGEAKQIGDVLGVEVVKNEIGGFKTVGATNILTNGGCVINNRGSDSDKRMLDKMTGFDSVRTTANTGSLIIGLASLANSKGLLVGSNTTGFEMERMLQALGD